MWRDTGLKPKFFFMDARALMGMFIFALHWSKITFYISSGTVVFFYVVSYLGFTPKSLLMCLRSVIFGRIRQSKDDYHALRRAHL